MAYEEYLDLYLKAQENPDAKYYVVSFDLINSKTMPIDKRLRFQLKLEGILKYVYNHLLDSEKELERQVVIRDPKFIRPWENKDKNVNEYLKDPNVSGDCFQFTIYRDTVTKEQIIEWVNECLLFLNLDVSFNVTDGYYETNEYGEGRTKYFRVYCLQTLETLHKPKIQNELKRIKKKQKIREI